MKMKLREFAVKKFHALLQIHDTPHSIAGGVAIGILFGFTPIFIPFVPVKTLLSIFSSWLFRCSKMAAVISVSAHDVIFPIWPFLLRYEYQIGSRLLHRELPPGHPASHHHIPFQEWFSMESYHSMSQWVHERLNWPFFVKVMGPMLLGSVVIGVPVALFFYFIVLRIVKRHQAVQRTKLQG